MQSKVQIDGELVAQMTGFEKPPLERGMKFECGKPKPSFVPYDVIAWLARVLEYGAEKYERDNWKRLDSEANQLKILDALERHIGEYKSGHRYDAESKMPVVAHVLTNAAFLVFFQVAAGGHGSNPHKLSEEQSKALKDARELGLRLREEAKRKDCDRIDASMHPGLVPSKLARAEAIGKSTAPLESLLINAKRAHDEASTLRLSCGLLDSAEICRLSGAALQLVLAQLEQCEKDSK